MFRLKRPTEPEIAEFLRNAASMPFSYDKVGATSKNVPPSYNVDHNRGKIGSGAADFELARKAVREWKMFDIEWAKLVPGDTLIEAGRTVAIVVSHLGFHSLNAARIVYIVDETGDVDRFGFAYGTLTEHAEIGEERFSVEFHRKTGDVWYDLFSFSRPGHPLATLGYPVSRFFQWAFASESMKAMKRAVEQARRDPEKPAWRDKISL